MSGTLRPALGRFGRQRGSALVEFAVVSIVFFTFIFGVTEFGRMTYYYSAVSTAARDGARWAAVRGALSGHPASATDVRNYVRTRLPRPLDTNAVITTTWPEQPTLPFNAPGNTVQVVVSYTFRPVITALVPQTALPLTSTTRMVISR